MRPIMLAFQVAVVATSMTIGKAFAPPRHLATYQRSLSWRRRISSSSLEPEISGLRPTTNAAGRQRYHGPRVSLLLYGSRHKRGSRRQAVSDIGVVRLASRGGVHRCVPSHHVGGGTRSEGSSCRGADRIHVALDSTDSGSSREQEESDSDADDVLIQANNDLGAELNESQREAVFAEVGAVRVVAGPGSGKTRVLTSRIAHLVRNMGAPAWSILAVTFTKKASEEMRVRVRKVLGEEVTGQVALGTFHSICARLLRRHGNALAAVVPGLDGRFSIFDTEDSRRMLTDIIKEMGQDIKEVKPSVIRSAISKLKSQGVGPEDIVEPRGLVGAAARHAKRVADIYKVYQLRLVQSNALDFDDIILVALRLLRQDEEVFRAVGRKYRHVLVDEWQDTNGPQYDIVLEIVRAGREAELAREERRRATQATREEACGEERAREAAGPSDGPAELGESLSGQADRLAGDGVALGVSVPNGSRLSVGPKGEGPPPPSIFVVGDTDQCIYKFRGADYTNVARFVEDFENCQTVLLRDNYRSTANIARAATAVIGQVSGRAQQSTIATRAVQGDGLPIGVMVCSDAEGEAAAVAHHLELYWTSGRVPASEMAVMYRTNAQSRSFEEACLRRALPFVVVGAQRFYERREVKDCLVYLRLAANPRDTLAMRRAINTPARGIGAKTELALQVFAESAREFIPGLTVPECLMVLLEGRDLEELEGVLGAAVGASSFPQEGAFGGGVGTWPGESEDKDFEAGGGGGDAEEEADGWRDFSVPRVRALKEALEERGGDIIGPTRAQANKLRVFAKLLLRLRVVSQTQGVPELLRVVLEETGMHKHVTETLSTTGPAEGEDRWQNVLELERAASNPKFSGIAGEGALLSFLNEVALAGGDDPKQARRQHEEEEAAAEEAARGGEGRASPVPGGAEAGAGEAVKPPVIQLMTVHASKGLEFDTVFVTGCEEGTFPIDKKDDQLDEERRLMYVGMTRAKARLFLTWRKKRMVFMPSTTRGHKDKRSTEILGIVDADRSRFIDDVPPNIVRTIDTTVAGGVGSGAGAGGKRIPYSGGRAGRGYGATRKYGGGGGSSRRGASSMGRGRDVPEPEHDPIMDAMTELSNDISRQASTRRSPGGGGEAYSGSSYGSRYGGGTSTQGRWDAGAAHENSNGSGGRGGGGGDRPYEWERGRDARDARVFIGRRRKVETAKYPVPAVRDGGRRIARESGEGVDMSWAAKLAKGVHDTPEPPPGVVVGAQVSHPIHGPGQVVALVEGSEAVNVRFVSKGQPFVTRVLGPKLKVLG